MKVLSLFDGISCGMVALQRVGFDVSDYAAYEIDKYATQISQKNYPQIEHYGDVFDGDFRKYQGFDLLIGGSPCTFWSIAKNNREITPDGIGGQLFMQFYRAWQESKCPYFLYENNYSIHKNIKAFIIKQLGVREIMINSALVSAQQRRRCYWTNIPNVKQPEDKNILLKDILESGVAWQDKAYAYTTRCQGAIFRDTLERHRHTMVAEPVIYQRSHGFNQDGVKRDKAPTLTATGSWVHNNHIVEPAMGFVNDFKRDIYTVKDCTVICKDKSYFIDLPDGDYIIRKLTPIEAERLQTLPDGYTEGVSNTQRYKCIGNGWTVDVIAHILSYLKNII